MKKIILIIFFFILVLVIIIKLFLYNYEKRSQQEQFFSTYQLKPQEISLLKEGDIILRHGYGVVSDMIVETLNEDIDISHCAILKRKDTSWFVIHSVSQSLSKYDGVQTQDLASFIKESQKNSVVVVRYKNLNDSSLHKIALQADQYLQKHIPFDHSFDMSDSSTFYCTELLFFAFKNGANVDILNGKFREGSLDHLKFHLFLDTTNFNIIIDHHQRYNSANSSKK